MTMQNVDRRTAIALGAAMFAPATLLPTPARPEIYAKHSGLAVMPGIRRIDLGRWPAPLANYRSVSMADYVIAPGSGFPAANTWHDTICHVLDGEVRVRKGREFKLSAGSVLVCAKGETKEIANPGELDAVMRFILLKT